MSYRKLRLCLIKLMVGSLLWGMGGLVLAQPFISYPGVRARAMGAAFVSTASDPSSVWYNPAGLATDSRELVFEWTQQSGTNLEENFIVNNFVDDGTLNLGELMQFVETDVFSQFAYDANRDAVFIGVGGLLQRGGMSVGLFYHRPYSFDWLYLPGSDGLNTIGQLDENIDIFGFAPAWRSLDGKFKIGMTIEYVTIRYRNSSLLQVNLDDQNPFWRPLSFGEEDQASGYSGSIGGLWEPVTNKKGWTFRIGGTWRASSDTELGEKADNTIDNRLALEVLFEKPSSWDIGCSIERSLGKLNSLATLSLQMGSTDFGTANEGFDLSYDNVNLGFEYFQNFSNDRAIVLRLGTYESTTDLSQWPDIEAKTGGVEFILGEKWSLSGTHELRTIETNTGLNGDNLGLSSVSINYVF